MAMNSVFDPLKSPHRQNGLCASLIRSTIALSAVAYTATLLLTFHSRWALHSTALAQYEALAMSEVCSNPQLRVRSEEVNNCAIADKMLNGGTLSPATLALLETLQRLALCAGEIDPSGRVQNRCDTVVEALTAASTKILVLAVILFAVAMWGARQYQTVSTVRATRLPLEDAAYPSNASLPPWLKED